MSEPEAKVLLGPGRNRGRARRRPVRRLGQAAPPVLAVRTDGKDPGSSRARAAGAKCQRDSSCCPWPHVRQDHTVGLADDVRPAGLDAFARHVRWDMVTGWACRRMGHLEVAITPVPDALAWCIDERPG
jgi:hypothetical protein